MHRLEDRGWIASFWGTSENNRKARYYRLTPAGRTQLVAQTTRWDQLIHASVASSSPSPSDAMRWTRFSRRSRWDAARSHELESYIQIETDDNIARGMAPDAARDAALRKRWVLMGTLALVMVIACANVANLLIVRVDGRQQELAVRFGLGAGSWRIVRELLLESITLALVGGVLGIALAFAALRFLVAMAPDTLPRREEIAIDPAALGFALGVSLLAGLVFGLIPASDSGSSVPD